MAASFTALRGLDRLDHRWSSLSRPSLSDAFDDSCDAHAAADAERCQPPAEVAALELVDQGAEDHRAGGAQRVTHRDRATVDVRDLVADAEVAHEPHRDRRERLVDLEQVDVADLEPGLRERLARGG